MYAWVVAKAKTNRRGRAVGTVVCATAAQAVQALGQECGRLRVPLCRRHARRVVEVGRCHGLPADSQISGQCPNAIQLLYRSVT